METWRHRHGDVKTWKHGQREKWRHGDIRRKMEAQAIFLNLFTVCSLYKRKFVICPFVDENQTEGIYLQID